MKEFIEKLIERLKEAKFPITDLKQGIVINGSQQTDDAVLYDRAISIVNELAEECKDKLDDEWQIIYNKILNLEKKYANDGNTESVNDCIKLENLLQYFKEELRSEEEYINTSTDTSTTNADRIRSMTDEELAEFFEKLEVVCDMCAFKVGCCNIVPDNCKSGLLKWLQSEVEGVTENE